MLKALGAFLLLFWMLSLLVHANGLASSFGIGALAVFLADLIGALRTRRISRRPRRVVI